jgi:hypothetical protein
MLLTLKLIKKVCCYGSMLVLFFFFTINQVNGQEEQEKNKETNGQEEQGKTKEVTLRDRLFFGGNLGLAFGSVTYIGITPLAGYRITPSWSAGIGVKYEYYKTSGYYGDNYSTSIYGGSIFTEYMFLKNVITKGISLIAHGEYEALSLDQQYFEDPLLPHGRFILNSVLVGGGIREHVGLRSSINIFILWNLSQTALSPYENPTIRLSFYF